MHLELRVQSVVQQNAYTTTFSLVSGDVWHWWAEVIFITRRLGRVPKMHSLADQGQIMRVVRSVVFALVQDLPSYRGIILMLLRFHTKLSRNQNSLLKYWSCCSDPISLLQRWWPCRHKVVSNSTTLKSLRPNSGSSIPCNVLSPTHQNIGGGDDDS